MSRPAWTPAELRAIVEETHRGERLTGAHIVPNDGIADCLDAGVDMLIHCSMYDADRSYHYRPDLADRIVSGGVWVNPTMQDIRAWIWHYRDVAAANGGLTEAEQTECDAISRMYDDKLDAVRRLHAAGARLMAGSDSPWGRSGPGRGWLEIDALTDGGLSASEALVAGTSGSAEAIGVGDVAGRLEVGRQADIVVVRGDPLADLRALGSPVEVWQAGKRVERVAA
jgi:imidazolonepropionase-like amidohydrolase